MSTVRQDMAFAELMQDDIVQPTIKESALQSAIDFIGNEFDPDDVFTDKQLSEWAERNGYVKE